MYKLIWLMTFTYKPNIQTKTKTQVSSIELSKNTLNSDLICSFQNIEERAKAPQFIW